MDLLSSVLALTLWVQLVEQGSGVVLPCIVATATIQNHNNDFSALCVFVLGRTDVAMKGASRRVATGKHVIHTGISGLRSVDAQTGICLLHSFGLAKHRHGMQFLRFPRTSAILY